jgi:hypothetical protein
MDVSWGQVACDDLASAVKDRVQPRRRVALEQFGLVQLEDRERDAEKKNGPVDEDLPFLCSLLAMLPIAHGRELGAGGVRWSGFGGQGPHGVQPRRRVALEQFGLVQLEDRERDAEKKNGPVDMWRNELTILVTTDAAVRFFFWSLVSRLASERLLTESEGNP